MTKVVPVLGNNTMYTQDTIKESDYEGWVAWIDGSPVINPSTQGIMGYENCTPLFENVPHNPKLASIITGVEDREVRTSDRQTIDWKNLPHGRVKVLELYAFRDIYPNQPLIQIAAQPNHDILWIQYKRGGLLIQTANNPHAITNTGQSRTGVSSWVMGYWDRTVGQAQIWDYPARGGKIQKKEFSGRNHPCWPTPLGFGLSPHVLGLNPEDVPALPIEFNT